MFAQQLVAGGEVEDKLCTREGEVIAGRCRSPHVFAELDAEEHPVARTEQCGVGTHHYLVSRIANFGGVEVLQRCKPAFLVELAIVGKVCLGDEGKYFALLDYCSTVEKQVANDDGDADDRDDVELTGEVEQHEYRLLGLLKECLLTEEVLTGVTRDAQLGEDDYLHAFPLSLGYLCLYLLNVEYCVGDAYRRYCRCYCNKSVFHNFQGIKILLSP